MRFQGTLAIFGIELGAESFVFLQHVEDVAQHLQDDDASGGARRGGARIKAHASHLAEQIAGPELGDGTVIGKLHRCIDGDECFVHALFRAAVLLAAHQLAAQHVEESVSFVVGIDVGARAGDEDIHLAFENVVGGGAVVAFAEKNVAFVDDPFHHRAAVEFEKSSGDAFEDGQLQQLLSLDGEAFADLLADNFFVGERAGGTGDHALAATHARRAAHGIVHVEGDAGVVAFALASDDEVVAQVRAGAHAAVAQNTGGVIDQNGERRIVLPAADFAHRIA